MLTHNFKGVQQHGTPREYNYTDTCSIHGVYGSCSGENRHLGYTSMAPCHAKTPKLALKEDLAEKHGIAG